MRALWRQIRALFVGGAIAYRALFNWTHPFMYVTTLFLSPLFELLFFAYLGRFTGVGSNDFFVVGNAVLACSGACVFGGTMAIANERRYRTLAPVLASPANRVVVFLGRGLPYVAHGLAAAVFILAGGALLLGFRMDLVRLPLLLAVVGVGAASCAAFGLALGAIGLRFRDVFIVSNLAMYTLILVSGAQVPRPLLPGWLQTVGAALPLAHAIAAARLVAAGAPWNNVRPQVLLEGVVMCAYALLAAALLRVFEIEARLRGTLETI